MVTERPVARAKPWLRSVLFAVPISVLVIILYYTWFAVRDRYAIFLYYHDMGVGFDTSPFGAVTVSRYWMTGLVASGAVMVLYLTANLVLGRLVKGYQASDWWRVWLCCTVPLVVAVPAIVMTVNSPTLPLLNAVQVVLALLVGLALAFRLGDLSASHPVGLFLLLVDGTGLVVLMSMLRAIEQIQRFLVRGYPGIIFVIIAGIVFSLVLMCVMALLYRWKRKLPIPSAVMWLVAAFDIHYLFLPLIHHLFVSTDEGSFTDADYFTYISDMENYFSRNWLVQLGVWVAVVMVAVGVTRMRNRMRIRLSRMVHD